MTVDYGPLLVYEQNIMIRFIVLVILANRISLHGVVGKQTKTVALSQSDVSCSGVSQ